MPAVVLSPSRSSPSNSVINIDLQRCGRPRRYARCLSHHPRRLAARTTHQATRPGENVREHRDSPVPNIGHGRVRPRRVGQPARCEFSAKGARRGGVVGPLRRRRGKLAAAALMSSLVLLGVFVAGGVMPYAGADDRQYEEFYTPPDPLPPGQPGDLIRTEPSRLALEPSGQLGAYVGTGTRIMYRSTDAQGNPVAVTGTYIEPDVPWPGNGPRPLLAYATGPYGAGEQCAPSRLFNQGIHFSQGFDLTLNVEEGWIATMLARGFAIVVTDGVGMGIH